MMRTTMFLLSFFLALHSLGSTSDAASESTGTNKAASNQGLTLDEIGRGLKSAAKNIEEEIPKIGPAIGRTFKQVTGGEKGTDNSSPKGSTSQSSTKSKK